MMLEVPEEFIVANSVIRVSPVAVMLLVYEIIIEEVIVCATVWVWGLAFCTEIPRLVMMFPVA